MKFGKSKSMKVIITMGVGALKIYGGRKLSARMRNEIKERTQENFQGNLTTGPSPCK